MSTSVSGSLAAGATLNVSPVELTAPFRGVQVEIAFTASGMPDEGLYISYATSIDNGSTYSDYQPLTQLAPTTSGTTMKSLLLDDTADHISFELVNSDPVSYSAVSISVEEF